MTEMVDFFSKISLEKLIWERILKKYSRIEKLICFKVFSDLAPV